MLLHWGEGKRREKRLGGRRDYNSAARWFAQPGESKPICGPRWAIGQFSRKGRGNFACTAVNNTDRPAHGAAAGRIHR